MKQAERQKTARKKQLSVSSCGSWGVKHELKPEHKRLIMLFQYPLADRGG
ncbi:MAG: hypothetical protein ANABAC_0664 [Anaerolineae bacterium]|nr:MAG: hypothetical protein ANABAC_0664 [Anaerolineae bacterium]